MKRFKDRKEWEEKKTSCDYFSGSFWKGLEYCWHQGWKEDLRAMNKTPESVCMWCDYDQCPIR